MGCTVFKIENFDATQIFREINYGEYKPTNFLQTQILREIRNSNTYIVLKLNTVKSIIAAAATIFFKSLLMRLLFESGYYFSAALIMHLYNLLLKCIKYHHFLQ